MTGTGVVRTEDVVCLCEVVAVGTGDGGWVLLICHIVNEDSVPDIRIHISHIQREWSTPRKNDGRDTTVVYFQITYWCKYTWQ